jgi:hypothetical protein
MTSPLFGIVIEHDEDRDVALLEKTAASILEIDYDPEKIKIIIHNMYVDYFQNIMHVVNIIKPKFPNCEMLMHLEKIPKARMEYECFIKIIEASYFIKINSGTVIDKKVLNNAASFLIDENKEIDLFESDSIKLVSRNRMNDLYLNFHDYEAAAEHIKKISIEQDKYAKI